MLNRISASLFVAVLSVTALIGCGGDVNKGIVRGQVTFRGKPVSDGMIRFESSGGVSENVNLDAEGKYQVQNYEGVGLPAGEYKVAVLPRVIVTGDTPPLAGVAPIENPSKKFPHIPLKFRDVATSQLSIKIERGTNPSFDFDLSK